MMNEWMDGCLMMGCRTGATHTRRFVGDAASGLQVKLQDGVQVADVAGDGQWVEVVLAKAYDVASWNAEGGYGLLEGYYLVSEHASSEQRAHEHANTRASVCCLLIHNPLRVRACVRACVRAVSCSLRLQRGGH